MHRGATHVLVFMSCLRHATCACACHICLSTLDVRCLRSRATSARWLVAPHTMLATAERDYKRLLAQARGSVRSLSSRSQASEAALTWMEAADVVHAPPPTWRSTQPAGSSRGAPRRANHYRVHGQTWSESSLATTRADQQRQRPTKQKPSLRRLAPRPAGAACVARPRARRRVYAGYRCPRWIRRMSARWRRRVAAQPTPLPPSGGGVPAVRAL